MTNERNFEKELYYHTYWEILMGESWEPVYDDEELRTKFLKFIRKLG